MSNISAAWTVTKAATPKTVQANGSKIVYNANSVARATMIFNNTDNALNDFFANEDEVEIKIGAQLMLVGFIEDIIDTRLKNRTKELQLEITDFGGYLAAKTSFERDFKRSTLPDTILETAAAEILGITTNVTNLDAAADKIKRNFVGTYVKDCWNTVVTNVGGDYFTDELKVFQAFAENSRELRIGGQTILITDQDPVSPHEFNPDYNFPVEYHRNAKDRYRSVIVTNNIKETYPNVADLYQTAGYKDDVNGKTFSAYFQSPDSNSSWSIDNTNRIPIIFFPTKDVGGSGQTMPTVQVPVLSTSSVFNIVLEGIQFGADGITLFFFNIGINILDWQFLAMYVDNQLARASGDFTITLMLLDDQGFGGFYSREIFDSADLPNSDINTGFTFLEYDLPANLTDAVSNGWTRTGNPTKIDQILITTSPSDGFIVDTFMEFGKVHFFRRRRARADGTGTPATEKIIIDSTAKSQNALQVLADKEQIRANKISKIGSFTLVGNTVFRNPGFLIDTDFTVSLGTGRSGFVRMDQIVHTLTNGIHKTRIAFKPSNMQP
ncbi:MAG: hypothetical protein O6761_07810 [Thaumarchaeota archaeon]|nr:hypothetical protein [Nitrososphaerota archaeon]